MADRSRRLRALAPLSARARLLSNGAYTVLLSGRGGGFSSWRGVALTRWSADRTLDGEGFFFYLRERASGAWWAATARPCAAPPRAHRAAAAPGSVHLSGVRHGIESEVEVFVAADVDAEVRILSLRNASQRQRHVEVTTCLELALAEGAAFAAHPAFRKLFVQTAIEDGAILVAARRPRGDDEVPLFAAHALWGEGDVEWESDRARFVGRGRDLAAPRALSEPAALSGAVGNVLDPLFALRRRVVLAPGASARLIAVLAAGVTHAAVVEAVRHFADPRRATAGAAAAARWERDLADRVGIGAREAEELARRGAELAYDQPPLRAAAAVLLRAPGALDPSALGLRGGVPYAVVDGATARWRSALGAALRAQLFWQGLGVSSDVALLAAGEGAGAEALRGATIGLDKAAGRRVVAARDSLAPAQVDALLATAALVLPVRRRASGPRHPQRPSFRRLRAGDFAAPADAASGDEPLAFANDRGGFAAAGSEYVVRFGGTAPPPPLPWVNVIANERFGLLVSESGAGCTWSRNSRENRLTPWVNDPVSDPHEEALYLRDEEHGVYWSPLPGPCPGPGVYEVRHGFGYSTWRHESAELEQETCVFVAREAPLRFTRLRLRNRSPVERLLSVFSFQRLVLGTTPAESGRFVVTEIDAASGALLAHNRFRGVFSDGVAFAAGGAAPAAEGAWWSGDRAAFLGAAGERSRPRGVCAAAELDGRCGAGLDPAAALQLCLRIPAGGSAECVFLLGEASGEDEARALCAEFADAARVESELASVRETWRRRLSAVRIETPLPALDVLFNGWLLYQVLSCRMWGRSAFYQSGGAIGFRDQLQDSSAFVYSEAARMRAQILLHAAHQFAAGDVLHWWHPPGARGIRTRFSDDLLWLPYLTDFYLRSSGDRAVLDEPVGFVAARPLDAGEDEAFVVAERAAERADLYTHCCLAIDRSLASGAHGLPLMGTGDWNDGMNRVGREGRGESVWLAFFLYDILGSFARWCEARGDGARLQRYRARRDELRAALEEHGWDGDWYRRAYYDDGTPLGSAQSDECRIDALAQAWAVISGAAPRDRAERAMDAVERQLVDSDAGLIRLLTPPFDRTAHDPGYIKGYVPGIRENGGQYTHAALWVVRALAELGRRDRAAPLLEMLSPVRHSDSAEKVAVYQVEPYVVAADVYGVAPHRGRGGWTWYTGSAAWMYRVALESVLGVTLEDGVRLIVCPRIPDDWPGYRVIYRLPDGATCCEIEVANPQRNAAAVVAAEVDGVAAPLRNGAAAIELHADGQTHRARIVLGP